jgi:hypothetical protein
MFKWKGHDTGSQAFLKFAERPASICVGYRTVAESEMRRNVFIPLLVLLAIGVYILVSHILAFIQIFFEHTGVAITQEEIGAEFRSDGADLRPQLIPKIIHHIFHNWHNVSMPKHWEETRQTCIDRNKDWDFIVSIHILSCPSQDLGCFASPTRCVSRC